MSKKVTGFLALVLVSSVGCGGSEVGPGESEEIPAPSEEVTRQPASYTKNPLPYRSDYAPAHFENASSLKCIASGAVMKTCGNSVTQKLIIKRARGSLHKVSLRFAGTNKCLQGGSNGVKAMGCDGDYKQQFYIQWLYDGNRYALYNWDNKYLKVNGSGNLRMGSYNGLKTIWYLTQWCPLSKKASLHSPGGSNVGSRPRYKWNPSVGAASYRLRVDGPSGKVFASWYKANQVCDCCMDSDRCKVRPSLVLKPGSYKWRVRTWSPTCGYGPWSNAKTFQVK